MLTIGLTVAAFLVRSPAATAATAAPPASPCLATLPAGEPDPQVRDVRIVTDLTNAAEPDVEACVVSNDDAAQMAVTFGMFDKAGHLVGSEGLSYGRWILTDGAGGSPRSILTVRVPVPVPANVTDASSLLDEVLATLEWVPCGAPASAPCRTPGGPRTPSTFLRPVLSDIFGATPKTARDYGKTSSWRGSRRAVDCTVPTASALQATVDTDRGTVKTQVTIDASCLNVAAPLGASFSLLKADGTLLSVTATDAIGGAGGTEQTYSATTDLGAADISQPLLGKVLVNVSWEACDPSVTTSCVNGTWHEKAYLLDAPQLSRKPR
jgi:hypothetical protein